MVTPHSSHAEYYLSGKSAPYVRGHRTVGGIAHVIETAQPAGDASGPPLSDLVLVQALSSGFSHRTDLGAGRFHATSAADDLFLIPPETATRIAVDDPHVLRILSVPARQVAAALPELADAGGRVDFGQLHAAPFRDDGIARLLDRIWQEADRDDAASRLFKESAIVTLLAALACRARDVQPRASRGGLAGWQVKRVKDYIRANLARNISLAELAGLVDLSSYHFCRSFRASTGMAPHRWQIAERVLKAEELLRDTELGIGEIAATVGYDASSQLARVFKAATGLSPRDYRRARSRRLTSAPELTV